MATDSELPQNMPTDPYDDILNRARNELSPVEQQHLIEELAKSVRSTNGRRRISELKGLGKELWQGIDADRYVHEERDSWNG